MGLMNMDFLFGLYPPNISEFTINLWFNTTDSSTVRFLFDNAIAAHLKLIFFIVISKMIQLSDVGYH